MEIILYFIQELITPWLTVERTTGGWSWPLTTNGGQSVTCPGMIRTPGSSVGWWTTPTDTPFPGLSTEKAPAQCGSAIWYAMATKNLSTHAHIVVLVRKWWRRDGRSAHPTKMMRVSIASISVGSFHWCRNNVHYIGIKFSIVMCPFVTSKIEPRIQRLHGSGGNLPQEPVGGGVR